MSCSSIFYVRAVSYLFEGFDLLGCYVALICSELHDSLLVLSSIFKHPLRGMISLILWQELENMRIACWFWWWCDGIVGIVVEVHL
jgi:hypothetical protein